MNITLTKEQLKNETYTDIEKCSLTKEQAKVIAQLLFDLFLEGDNNDEEQRNKKMRDIRKRKDE